MTLEVTIADFALGIALSLRIVLDSAVSAWFRADKSWLKHSAAYMIHFGIESDWLLVKDSERLLLHLFVLLHWNRWSVFEEVFQYFISILVYNFLRIVHFDDSLSLYLLPWKTGDFSNVFELSTYKYSWYCWDDKFKNMILVFLKYNYIKKLNYNVSTFTIFFINQKKEPNFKY